LQLTVTLLACNITRPHVHWKTNTHKVLQLTGLFHIATSTRRRVLAESTRLRVLAASIFRIDASEFKAGNTLCVIFCCCTYYCLVFV